MISFDEAAAGSSTTDNEGGAGSAGLSKARSLRDTLMDAPSQVYWLPTFAFKQANLAIAQATELAGIPLDEPAVEALGKVAAIAPGQGHVRLHEFVRGAVPPDTAESTSCTGSNLTFCDESNPQHRRFWTSSTTNCPCRQTGRRRRSSSSWKGRTRRRRRKQAP